VTACAAGNPGAAFSLFSAIVVAINSANSGNKLTGDKESEGDEEAPADPEQELLRRGLPLRLVKCCGRPEQVFFGFVPRSFGSGQPTHTYECCMAPIQEPTKDNSKEDGASSPRPM
jgi:hypothetical protein